MKSLRLSRSRKTRKPPSKQNTHDKLRHANKTNNRTSKHTPKQRPRRTGRSSHKSASSTWGAGWFQRTSRVDAVLKTEEIQAVQDECADLDFLTAPRVGFFINGLETPPSLPKLTELQKSLSDGARGLPIRVIYNPSIKDMINDIMQLMVFKLAPQDTDFVHHVYKKVWSAVQRQQRVRVVGFSYGGSVVTRVGELLDKYHPSWLRGHDPQVELCTTGSVYLAPINVPITQIMYLDDVSIRVHQHKPPTKGSSHPDSRRVYWVDNPTIPTTVTQSPSLWTRVVWGTPKEWYIHGQYVTYWNRFFSKGRLMTH